jgi:hypothetical protein
VHVHTTLTHEYRSSALFKGTYASSGLGWVDMHIHLAVDGRAFPCLAYLAFERMALQTDIKKAEFVRNYITIPSIIYLIHHLRALAHLDVATC